MISAEVVKPKHAGGRPRLKLEEYLPEGWQERVLDMYSEGYSDCEIRANLCWDMASKKFNHGTWDALELREEEFFAIIKKGHMLSQSWWERQGRQGLKEPIFNTGLWYANMKNRFGYRDKVDHEHNVNVNLPEIVRQASRSTVALLSKN